jgi:hypothetical protein
MKFKAHLEVEAGLFVDWRGGPVVFPLIPDPRPRRVISDMASTRSGAKIQSFRTAGQARPLIRAKGVP